jgi:hypothetical protein
MSYHEMVAHSLRFELRYHELTARLTTIVIRMNIVTKGVKILCGPALYVLRPTCATVAPSIIGTGGI